MLVRFAAWIAASILLVPSPGVAAREAPSITVSPARGTVGSSVTITGSGYQSPDETVLTWDGIPIDGQVPINENGTFRASVTVSRSTYIGDHEIVARGLASGAQARATFTVFATLAMTATPDSGEPGDRVTIRGTGYDTCPNYGSGVVQIYWNGLQQSPAATPPIRDDGTFSAEVAVPRSAEYQTYQLVGQCRDSGEYATTNFSVQQPGPPEPSASPTPSPSPSPTAHHTDPVGSTAPGPRPEAGAGTPPIAQPPPLPSAAPSVTPSPQQVPRQAPQQVPQRLPQPAGSTPPAVDAQPATGREGGWPRPEIIDAIRVFGEPGYSPAGLVLLLLILAVLAWVMIGWPAELFNRTYEENEEVIRGWLRLRTPPVRSGQSWPVVAGFSVLAAVVVALAEPGPVLDREVVVTMLGLLVAVPVVAVGYEFAIESYHRLAPGAGAARLRVIYPALAVAAVCASASRLLDFVPGYAYGLIVSYTIVASRRRDPRRDAVAVLRGAALVLGLAVVAWLLRQFGTAGPADGADAPFGLRLVDTILGLITVLSLETLVIGLMPLRFLHGRKLWTWNRLTWLAVYVAGAAAFVIVLIGPLPRAESRVSEVAQIARMLWLFLGFAAGSFAFWGFFTVRRRWLRPRSPAPRVHLSRSSRRSRGFPHRSVHTGRLPLRTRARTGPR